MTVSKVQRFVVIPFTVILVIISVFGLRWYNYSESRDIVTTSSTSSGAFAVTIPKKRIAQLDNVESTRSSDPPGVAARPLAKFRSGTGEPAAVLGVLASGKESVDERVLRLRSLRGKGFSEEEHRAALAFLAGKNVPEVMGKASMHWLADELLTVMRLQVPPAAGLAGELGEIAFRAETDPVVRDYIMQHLGHLWEQFGAREEIEKSLWRAVASSDQTTPGTALIALSRGYQREQQPENLQKVRERALALLQNPATGLAVQVTALAIAGNGGSQEVRAIAQELAGNEQTPLILKRVAERIAGK